MGCVSIPISCGTDATIFVCPCICVLLDEGEIWTIGHCWDASHCGFVLGLFTVEPRLGLVDLFESADADGSHRIDAGVKAPNRDHSRGSGY